MRVGDLARETGLTVRTLHHYDELGLVVPSARTAAGHRIYEAADVRRLYQVVALRGLGLPLGESARCWTARRTTRSRPCAGSSPRPTGGSRPNARCGCG